MKYYLGQLWAKTIDTQASLIKDSEFDSYLDGTLRMDPKDPRFNKLANLDDALVQLEVMMIENPIGNA